MGGRRGNPNPPVSLQVCPRVAFGAGAERFGELGARDKGKRGEGEESGVGWRGTGKKRGAGGEQERDCGAALRSLRPGHPRTGLRGGSGPPPQPPAPAPDELLLARKRGRAGPGVSARGRRAGGAEAKFKFRASPDEDEEGGGGRGGRGGLLTATASRGPCGLAGGWGAACSVSPPAIIRG